MSFLAILSLLKQACLEAWRKSVITGKAKPLAPESHSDTNAKINTHMREALRRWASEHNMSEAEVLRLFAQEIETVKEDSRLDA